MPEKFCAALKHAYVFRSSSSEANQVDAGGQSEWESDRLESVGPGKRPYLRCGLEGRSRSAVREVEAVCKKAVCAEV